MSLECENCDDEECTWHPNHKSKKRMKAPILNQSEITDAFSD